MKLGVYLCNCGSSVSDKVDYQKVIETTKGSHDDLHFSIIDFMCSEEGKELFEKDLVDNGIDRAVIAACSPRDHEGTFMKCMEHCGRNPYLMHMVNVREQVAWVTEDKEKATAKAARYVNGGIARVCLQEPLEDKEIEVSPDVVVIGAGPAGLKAALSLAESGRKVVVVEKTPVIGGMPVRYEELFPNMECGPCMLEPLEGDILHGEYAENIEILTMAEVEDVLGSYGNFIVKIRQKARYVSIEKCIGCQECIEPCPESAPNEFNYDLSARKAISFPFAGALPNAPFIDPEACLRFKGGACTICRDVCPVEGTVLYDDTDRVLERHVGAIIVATGAENYDCEKIPNLGYSKIPDVYTGAEFERIAASNGPSGGEIATSEGEPIKTVAIVHCVGSLDKNHMEYCSGVCCQYAFKFNHVIKNKIPDAKIVHLYKEIAIAGKEESALYHRAKEDPATTFIRYDDIEDLKVSQKGDVKTLSYVDSVGKKGKINPDIVILCPAVVPVGASGKLGAILDIARDKYGFFEELHGRMDSSKSKIKGIFLAGTCQSPMDIQKSINQGMAASGNILSALVTGRKLEIKPIIAVVDEDRCSGCRVCILACPYTAIAFDTEKEVSRVNELLCMGCGTCVSACPSGAMKGNHFTNEEIFAEIEGVLA